MPDQQFQPQHDGTIDGAVAMMGDDIEKPLRSFEDAQNAEAGLPSPDEIRQLQQLRDRDEKGRFAKPDPQTQKPASQAAPAEPALEQQSTEPTEEFFELPPEKEGGEPRRIAATEVWKAYEDLPALRQELENAKRIAPPPIEWDQQMLETVRARGQLIEELNLAEQYFMPMEPDADLINQNSSKYDPAAYAQQLALQRHAMQRVNMLRSRREELVAQKSREQAALAEARMRRESNKLSELWPELKDPSVQRRVRDEAARFYSVTDQDFRDISDSRFYHLLKDALAYRQMQNQRQTAVKVVRSVPKLVKSQARSTPNRGQELYAKGMQRLASSGSLEDAAAAIGAVLPDNL